MHRRKFVLLFLYINKKIEGCIITISKTTDFSYSDVSSLVLVPLSSCFNAFKNVAVKQRQRCLQPCLLDSRHISYEVPGYQASGDGMLI